MGEWHYDEKYRAEERNRAYGREEECLSEALSLVELCLAAAGEERTWIQGGNEAAWPRREEAKREFQKALEHLYSREEATRRAGRRTRLFYVKRVLEMGQLEFFGMVCVLASEYSQRHGRLFASLQGNGTMKYATPGLVLELYELVNGPVPAREQAVFLNQTRPFWLLIQPGRDAEIPFSARPLLGGGRLLQFLFGNGIEGTLLGETAVKLPGTEEAICLYEEEYHRICSAWHQMEEEGEQTGVLLLSGKAGSGKKFLLRHLAGKEKREVCLVNLGGVMELSVELRENWFRQLLLERRLSEALLAFEGSGELFLPGTDRQLRPQARWLLERLSGMGGVVAFLGDTELSPSLFEGARTVSISLNMPGPRQKVRMWEFFSRPYELAADVNLERLGSQYVLNSGEMKAVLQTASLLAGADGQTSIGRRYLTEAVASHNSRMLGDVAVRVSSVFTWEDLVVEPSVKRQLEHICSQVRYRNIVADDWNFYGKTPYGRGVCALFYGAPGTGKTMAAQVIAGDLGLELYRIDISQLVSKYIGETEKHISELFEKAKDINAVLFFDEADALFARRSEVSDANDRSANMETAHLLQKLEEYEGIVLLATNLKENIDEAFRRRIRFMIRFSLPDEATRRMLWEKVIPREAPLEREVDLDGLARCFELSGSAIKEIALNAAYMAAAEGGCIGARHLAEAFRLYYGKLGKQLTGQELEAFL